MKVNGTEDIIKLLLEVKVGEGGIENPDRTENLEKTLQKVDEMIHKDEFIRSGTANNVKAEIQFSKNLNESPEAYLHRISTEVISQRQSDQTYQNDSRHPNNTNRNEIVETAARTGLLKGFLVPQNENSNRTYGDLNNKWLVRIISVFLLVLLIYYLLMQ